MRATRHAKRPAGFLFGGTCAECKGAVDIAEAMKVRPGQLPFGNPLHDECYTANLIIMGNA